MSLGIWRVGYRLPLWHDTNQRACLLDNNGCDGCDSVSHVFFAGSGIHAAGRRWANGVVGTRRNLSRWVCNSVYGRQSVGGVSSFLDAFPNTAHVVVAGHGGPLILLIDNRRHERDTRCDTVEQRRPGADSL